jgi:hypothetical protein
VRVLGLVVGLIFANSAFAAEIAWMTEGVQAKRFLGEEVVGPFFEAGTRLDVLVEEGEWIRVRKGEDFGWVELKSITKEEPVAATPEAPALPALPELGK